MVAGHVASGRYAYWLVPVAVLIMLFSPFGPPPPKRAEATQKPPVLKPADPFDDINIIDPKKLRKGQKIDTIGSMPAVVGIRSTQ